MANTEDKMYQKWKKSGRKSDSGVFDRNMRAYECRKQGNKWVGEKCVPKKIPKNPPVYDIKSKR